MLTPSTAVMKSSGKLGATPFLSRSPSASKNRIVHKEPLNISSTSRHNASRIVASELFPVINSRIFFSATSTASAHLRSSMSVFVPYHLTMFPVSSNKRFETEQEPTIHPIEAPQPSFQFPRLPRCQQRLPYM